MLENRDNHDINYSNNITNNLYLETLISNLIKYEDTNLEFYVDSDKNLKLVAHADLENVKNRIKSSVCIKPIHSFRMQD